MKQFLYIAALLTSLATSAFAATSSPAPEAEKIARARIHTISVDMLDGKAKIPYPYDDPIGVALEPFKPCWKDFGAVLITQKHLEFCHALQYILWVIENEMANTARGSGKFTAAELAENTAPRLELYTENTGFIDGYKKGLSN